MLVALAATNRELRVPGLLDQASLHELGHETGGGLGRVSRDLEFSHFLLKGIELGQFSLSLGLLHRGRLLIFADLLDGPTPFAVHLQHVR